MMQASEVPDKVTLKVIVLGCSNVGKTSLIRRYAAGTFSAERRATTGADFSSKQLFMADQKILLQIWDTAGQERFHQGTLGGAFYRGSHGALLVYDLANLKSFEQCEMWLNELYSRIDVSPSDFPVVVVANKSDLADSPTPENAAQRSEILRWCGQRGFGHIETSAKDGTGVQAAMEAIVMRSLENMHKLSSARDRNKQDNVKLDEMYKNKSSTCGCS